MFARLPIDNIWSWRNEQKKWQKNEREKMENEKLSNKRDELNETTSGKNMNEGKKLHISQFLSKDDNRQSRESSAFIFAHFPAHSIVRTIENRAGRWGKSTIGICQDGEKLSGSWTDEKKKWKVKKLIESTNEMRRKINKSGKKSMLHDDTSTILLYVDFLIPHSVAVWWRRLDSSRCRFCGVFLMSPRTPPSPRPAIALTCVRGRQDISDFISGSHLLQ